MQLVRDDDDRLAVGLHVAHDGKELVRFLRGENGGRLIEDENVRAAVENFYDLNGLLFGDGHIINFLGRVDLKAVTIADLLHAEVDLLHAQLLPVVETQHNVFRCGEDVDQLEVLVDHANVIAEGVLRGGDHGVLTVDVDLPLVGEVNAAEHIHQRCFSAAVFAQQREDFAALQRQRNVVVSHNGAEAFGYAFQFNCVYGVQGCHPFLLA